MTHIIQFLYMVWVTGPTSFSCIWMVVLASFLKKTILFPLSELHTLVKSQLTVDVWFWCFSLFSGLSVLFHWSVCLSLWEYYTVLITIRCLIAQLCPTPCNPTDCSPPGSSVLQISQARILEQVAISFSRGSSRPRDQTGISCSSYIGRQSLYHWSSATWEAQSFILSFEVGKCESSNFAILFQDHFGFWAPLILIHILRSAINFFKDVSWTIDKDCVEYIVQFEEDCHLNNITPLIHKHGCFSIYVGLLISFNSVLKLSWYYDIFEAILNEIFLLISFFGRSLIVYRNTIVF